MVLAVGVRVWIIVGGSKKLLGEGFRGEIDRSFIRMTTVASIAIMPFIVIFVSFFALVDSFVWL